VVVFFNIGLIVFMPEIVLDIIIPKPLKHLRGQELRLTLVLLMCQIFMLLAYHPSWWCTHLPDHCVVHIMQGYIMHSKW